MTAAPPVSIGLTVFNDAAYLAATLESLLAQDYTDFELRIHDDASTDASGEIARAFARRDARVIYQRNERNLGGYRSYNLALASARGPYYVHASGNDRYAPTFLGRCLELLERESAVVLCYPQVGIIDDAGIFQAVLHDYLDTRGLSDPVARAHAVLWGNRQDNYLRGVVRTAAFRAAGPFPRCACAEGPVLLGLALQGCFAQVSEVLFYKRWTRAHFTLTPEEQLTRMLRFAYPDLSARALGRQAVYAELVLKLARVALRAPWPGPDRLGLLASLGVRYHRYLRHDLARALRTLVGLDPSGRSREAHADPGAVAHRIYELRTTRGPQGPQNS